MKEDLISAFDIIIQNKDFLLNEDLKHDNDFLKIKKKALESSLIALNISGQNYLHNHKYREDIMFDIACDYIKKNNNNGIHGKDIDINYSFESKSVSQKKLKSGYFKISLNTKIGEIDKVYNKINNQDEKYSENTVNHLLCAIFENTSATPCLMFYLENKDFGRTIQPLLMNANNELQKNSNNLTKKKRDSYSLKINNFIKCPSFDIIYCGENINIANEIYNAAQKKLKDKIDVYRRKGYIHLV